MNLFVCLLMGLVLLTAPGDFAANRLFLLLLLFTLGLLHHHVKGRPKYYRITEYGLIGSVFVVWAAGFFSPHYFLLQPLINMTLTFHAISAVAVYWPTEEQAKRRAFGVLYKAAPWFIVALLAQWKASDWLPQVTLKEKTLPAIVIPGSPPVVVVPDSTTRSINLFDSLSKTIRP